MSSAELAPIDGLCAAIQDVLIIGAGLSGIGAARHLQQHCPAQRWAIVEARESIGGTWDLFRYPGVRSDLGYNFLPWTERKAIADGPSILRYIRRAADEGGVHSRLHLGQRVIAADWDGAQGLWQARLLGADGQERVCSARFLYFCSGYYSYTQAHRPSFEGEQAFAGQIVHPQFWPEDLDYANKRVVIIGSGATAMTLVPEMAKTAAHVVMLQRSPTYVISRPSVDGLAAFFNKLLPDAWAYALTRWKNVLLGMYFYGVSKRRPAAVKRYLLSLIRKEMGPDYEVDRHFSPSYNPWDQRICLVPDADLFRQLKAGRASVVTDSIARFSQRGIVLASDKELEADIIVTATGLSLNVLGDVAVSVNGTRFEPAQAVAYKGLMLSGLPNAFMSFGYVNASWTLRSDLTAGYVCRLLNHMDVKGYRVAMPQADPDVVRQAFMGLSSGYVQRAQAVLPQQGDRDPWQAKRNYVADLFALRFKPLEDGVLKFSAEGAA
jgi:monooxygenase